MFLGKESKSVRVFVALFLGWPVVLVVLGGLFAVMATHIEHFFDIAKALTPVWIFLLGFILAGTSSFLLLKRGQKAKYVGGIVLGAALMVLGIWILSLPFDPTRHVAP